MRRSVSARSPALSRTVRGMRRCASEGSARSRAPAPAGARQSLRPPARAAEAPGGSGRRTSETYSSQLPRSTSGSSLPFAQANHVSSTRSIHSPSRIAVSAIRSGQASASARTSGSPGSAGSAGLVEGVLTRPASGEPGAESTRSRPRKTAMATGSRIPAAPAAVHAPPEATGRQPAPKRRVRHGFRGRPHPRSESPADMRRFVFLPRTLYLAIPAGCRRSGRTNAVRTGPDERHSVALGLHAAARRAGRPGRRQEPRVRGPQFQRVLQDAHGLLRRVRVRRGLHRARALDAAAERGSRPGAWTASAGRSTRWPRAGVS